MYSGKELGSWQDLGLKQNFAISYLPCNPGQVTESLSFSFFIGEISLFF